MVAEAISQSATGNSVLYVFCVFVSLWQIPLRLRALCEQLSCSLSATEEAVVCKQQNDRQYSDATEREPQR